MDSPALERPERHCLQKQRRGKNRQPASPGSRPIFQQGEPGGVVGPPAVGNDDDVTSLAIQPDSRAWAQALRDKDADAIIEAKGLKQITDTGAIEKVIDEIMAANPRQLADYRSGKDKLFGFFVGQVMKVTGGKANPAQVNDLLKRKLAG